MFTYYTYSILSYLCPIKASIEKEKQLYKKTFISCADLVSLNEQIDFHETTTMLLTFTEVISAKQFLP
jgi:hypothetical protein